MMRGEWSRGEEREEDRGEERRGVEKEMSEKGGWRRRVWRRGVSREETEVRKLQNGRRREGWDRKIPLLCLPGLQTPLILMEDPNS